jgi:hypothetical protein
LGRVSRLELVASSVLTQIYEVSTPDEARLISRVGVDHIGILVGNGEFPRELLVDSAAAVAAAVLSPSRVSALFLTADLAIIEKYARELSPAIVHLGAAPELLSPDDAASVKSKLPDTLLMRSVPVVDEESIAIARSYDAIAVPAARQSSSFRSADRRARRDPRLDDQPPHRRTCPNPRDPGRRAWTRQCCRGDPRGSTYRCRLEDEDRSNRLTPEGHQPRETILRSGSGGELVRRVRLHNDYVTSAGILKDQAAGSLSTPATLKIEPFCWRGEGTPRAVLGIDRILLSVDYPYGRSSAPICQAGGGSSTRSNTRPLEPSPRPMGDSRPIQRNVAPSVQRARRKPRVTSRPARGTSSSATK